MEGPVMKVIIAATFCLVFSSVGFAGERHGVFASCQTRDDGPRLRIEIVKHWDSEGGGDWIDAKFSILLEENLQWVSRRIRGTQLDLGRDPICEVYQFRDLKTGSADAEGLLTEVGVCFERHNDGTYGGYVLEHPGDGPVVERRLSCVYPG